MSTQYLIQNPVDGEFFSSFYYSGEVSTIPVLFGAEEYKTKEEAFLFKKNEKRLDDFIVVARKSKIIIVEVKETEKQYADHELRVIDEQSELEDKLKSLNVFIESGKQKFIDKENWDLLIIQKELMGSYNDLLKKRISLFK